MSSAPAPAPAPQLPSWTNASGFEDRVVPAARLLYTSRDEGSKVRKEYFSSFFIQHNSDIYQWKVHIGDVVVVSMANDNNTHSGKDGFLALRDIEEWQPDHLTKASPHWKVGLVLALAQVIDPQQENGKISFECHVEWLEKALDTKFANEKKLRDHFRPWKPRQERCKLPHLLFRSFRYATVKPENLLPTQITMLTDADFKDGWEWDPENRFEFHMHCPKKLEFSEDGKCISHQADDSVDAWHDLNHSSFSKKKAIVPSPLPKPLVQAWSKWGPVLRVDGLLPALIQGYRDTVDSKGQEFLNFKNRQWKEKAAEEERLWLEVEASNNNNNNNNNTKRASRTAGKRAAAKDDVDSSNHPGNKRVRINEPGNTPEGTKTASGTTKGKNSIKSIIKKTAKSVKTKIQSVSTPKAKSSKTNKSPVNTTPSTKSTISTSSPDDVLPVIHISKKQLKMKIRAPKENIVHRGKYQSQTCHFYERVNLYTEQESRPRVVMIGEVVAVSTQDSHPGDRSVHEPFGVSWGVAQVLALYQVQESCEWTMQIRWLLRYHEVPESSLHRLLQKRVKLDADRGLLETTQVVTSPIQAILPAKVIVRSSMPKGDILQSSPPSAMGDSKLPTLDLQCRHFQDEYGVIAMKRDWEEFDAATNIIKGPMMRAFGSMRTHSRVVEKYKLEVKTRICDSEDEDDDTSMEESLPALQISPISSTPIFERWGVKFHDGVQIDIDPKTLHASFTPRTKQRSIKVGHVVPIACEDRADEATPDPIDTSRWYPFICRWSPAQIVSIYEDERGQWKMQIRWFYRYHELLPQQQSGSGVLDKPHVIFETESYDHLDVKCCLPGRVVLSSSVCDNWDAIKSNRSGLPLIPRFCSHICLDDEIDESPDWTNYDAMLPSCPKPLMRGLLLDPRNRTRKEWILMLSRYYSKHIGLRGQDVDEDLLRRWVGNGLPASPLTKRGGVTFDEKKVKAELGDTWYTEQQGDDLRLRHFSGSLDISVPLEFIAKRSKVPRKARALQFKGKVGDIVAFYDEEAGPKSDHALMKHLRFPWYPFRVPWSFGQLLAVYCDEDSVQSPLVEIRRFYRFSEIPQDHRALAPLADDAEREQVFESNDVCAVPAPRIIGLSGIHLGRHQRASQDINKPGILTSCRCKYFYYSTFKRFLPIFSSSFSPAVWWDRLLARGISFSPSITSTDGLGTLTIASSKRREALDVHDLLGDGSLTPAGATGTSLVCQKQNLHFFTAASLFPNWNELIDAGLHFPRNDRDQISWKVKLGDLLAARGGVAVTGKESTIFPFLCPWSPCQLLAIYSDGGTSLEALRFEVRFFQTESDGFQVDNIRLSECRGIATLKYSDLLGPVRLLASIGKTGLDWDSSSQTLPYAVVFGDERPFPDLKEMIQLSNSYTADVFEGILKSVRTKSQYRNKKDCDFEDVVDTEDGTRNATLGDPVFVDNSKLCAFYQELRLVAQKNWFVHRPTTTPMQWHVKIGDVVLIHCDGPTRFPLNCNWGVAEVVAIWKEFDGRDALEKYAYSSVGDCQSVKVEIRWFYERHDVAGISNADAEMESNEVLETDDMFVLDDLSTILGPAKLHSDPGLPAGDEKFMNLPVVDLVCRRFWSTKRKSLIPCGGLEGRQQRGRLYSQILPMVFTATTASLSTQATGPAPKTETARMDWTASVRAIIAKLNLKDASKHASAGRQTLVGREKELSQILSFFRAAIRGEPGPGGIRSSMLIAGPPGVGKTQSIHSAISRLYSEQARGEIPSFNFVPLNGMEMRHPFEAYVKFWEAITGRKHVGSHEKACQKLEYHFTNAKAASSDNDRTVTVVLLDEIDYLVTDKQAVLYNFFDWPKRAASIPDGRRLVVIGVSNTLNLAEQLMPSVQSRLGTERIAFRAYNVKDATAILKAKIEEASPDFSIFENDAILFAAKKTAAMSGDIRKAFQICRGAAELVLRRSEDETENRQKGAKSYPTVHISDIQQASRESFDSALVTAVSFSTPFQALVLVSLASLCRTTGREVGGFDITDIITKMESIVGSVGDPQYAPPPSFGETLQLLNRLAETNLVTLRTSSSSTTSFRSCAGGSGGAWPMAALAVDEHAIVRGFKNTSHKALAEQILPSLFQ